MAFGFGNGVRAHAVKHGDGPARGQPVGIRATYPISGLDFV
jgi:hypothetical protein